MSLPSVKNKARSGIQSHYDIPLHDIWLANTASLFGVASNLGTLTLAREHYH